MISQEDGEVAQQPENPQPPPSKKKSLTTAEKGRSTESVLYGIEGIVR